jgi:hypothetical protein
LRGIIEKVEQGCEEDEDRNPDRELLKVRVHLSSYPDRRCQARPYAGARRRAPSTMD